MIRNNMNQNLPSKFDALVDKGIFMVKDMNTLNDTINRIIGMNYSIACDDCESERYSDARVVSLVVNGVE